MQSVCCRRFTPEELAPFLQPLLEKLFAAFRFPESGENEYLMKCVMRVITFVGESRLLLMSRCWLGGQGQEQLACEGASHCPCCQRES